jgi:hypothetical protein
MWRWRRRWGHGGWVWVIEALIESLRVAFPVSAVRVVAESVEGDLRWVRTEVFFQQRGRKWEARQRKMCLH